MGAGQAVENATWGEERIADELQLKLGIRVSPRTVGKYLQQAGPRRAPDPQQRWLTFLRNHAKAIVACDFFTVVTINFRTLYVLVIMEIGARRILHHNVTAHPTAEWTLQQFREALPGEHSYRDSQFGERATSSRGASGARRRTNDLLVHAPTRSTPSDMPVLGLMQATHLILAKLQRHALSSVALRRILQVQMHMRGGRAARVPRKGQNITGGDAITLPDPYRSRLEMTDEHE